MSFWKKLFVSNKVEGNELINSPELEKMMWASKKNCWAAALWLSVKILKIDPVSITAKDIFEKSFANTSVGMVILSDENQKKMEFVTNLLKQRRMSLKEANIVADSMVSVFYVKFLTERVHPMLDRFNKGEIIKHRRIEDSDLDTAKDLANSLWNVILPGQKIKIKWEPIYGSESELVITKNITSFKNALATMLLANYPADWQKTCKQIQEHLKDDNEIVAAFEALKNENYTDNEFKKQRDNFEITFAKEIAQMLQIQNLREPIINL